MRKKKIATCKNSSYSQLSAAVQHIEIIFTRVKVSPDVQQSTNQNLQRKIEIFGVIDAERNISIYYIKFQKYMKYRSPLLLLFAGTQKSTYRVCDNDNNEIH